MPEKQVCLFHRYVAQLLLVSTRVRGDIKTAVAFLTMRVKSPDGDDWGKLGRVMRYLARCPDLPLTLEASQGISGVVNWWVDASYAVHMDYKGHIWGMMSIGKGAIMDLSRKKKVNAQSSTESELIGVDDYAQDDMG